MATTGKAELTKDAVAIAQQASSRAARRQDSRGGRKTVLVEGVMKRELRELRIASLVATLLAAVVLAGCAARIHTPFVPGDKLAGPTLVRSAPSEFEYIDTCPTPRT